MELKSGCPLTLIKHGKNKHGQEEPVSRGINCVRKNYIGIYLLAYPLHNYLGTKDYCDVCT